ncbi:response regulator [bacterium]|jgi:two-component system chemotaxis response regulator CheY|nr:response regulator [bacterium]
MEEILRECAADNALNGLDSDGKQYKVLIVDDAMFVRNTLNKILMSVGYDVVGEAKNGQEAVQLYAKLQPDVVTLDVTMPVMNGIDAVEKIREGDPSARIVMLSAMGYQCIVQKAILKGAKNYVVKPINEGNVVDFLQTVKKAASV